MEAHEDQHSSRNTKRPSTNFLYNNMIENMQEEKYYGTQEDKRPVFLPNSDTNEQLHMVEFQRAIDRLRLRRQSSTSSQSVQAQDGSRKNSVVRDLLQGQKFRTTPNFSSTCTSPISSNGAYFIFFIRLFTICYMFNRKLNTKSFVI